MKLCFACIANPQQGHFRLLGPPSGQVASGEVQARDKTVLADFMADSLSTGPLKPLDDLGKSRQSTRKWNIRDLWPDQAYLAFVQSGPN
ncbi:hypothetical protein PoB_005434100 [Plakobranchus ocellatus]|uniref:Uncharacterized protein n=1 Tax=Plakobranchus ocellatus TaxID=259542 RepID=A0AAV4BXF0_9GAST|nr:hypothetical protein PoB_005434100 [Plakobranchus ocellatus]